MAQGVPGAEPWGRWCTGWAKWIVGLERADGTGSRWSREQLSGRPQPDGGPRKGPEMPWTLLKEHGQARRGEPGAWVSEKKRKGSGRREGAAGLSAGARRGHPGGWQGPSRIPKGSRTHLGGRHCRGSTHSLGLGVERGRRLCGCTSPNSYVSRDTVLRALSLQLSACTPSTSEAARLPSSASAAPHQPGPRGVPLGVQPASRGS